MSRANTVVQLAQGDLFFSFLISSSDGIGHSLFEIVFSHSSWEVLMSEGIRIIIDLGEGKEGKGGQQKS